MRKYLDIPLTLAHTGRCGLLPVFVGASAFWVAIELIQHSFNAICDRNVSEIIKRSVVQVKRCERPSDLEVSGHSLRVGAAQDLLIKGYDLAAIMRAGGWSDPSTVSRYLRFSQHNIWK